MDDAAHARACDAAGARDAARAAAAARARAARAGEELNPKSPWTRCTNGDRCYYRVVRITSGDLYYDGSPSPRTYTTWGTSLSQRLGAVLLNCY